MLLCSQANDFWSNSENPQRGVITWFLLLYLHEKCRSPFPHKHCGSSLKWAHWRCCDAVLKEVQRCSAFRVLLAESAAAQGCLPREMEIPESALDFAVSVHGRFPNPHSQLWPAARFGTIMQVSSLLVSHSELSCSFLPLKDSPTFHVHSAKLYLTCNLKPKMPWYKALLQ